MQHAPVSTQHQQLYPNLSASDSTSPSTSPLEPSSNSQAEATGSAFTLDGHVNQLPTVPEGYGKVIEFFILLYKLL